MDIDIQTNLLDELQSLLEKQLETARRGSIHNIEDLSKQAASVVGKIVKAGILESAEFKNRQEKLEKLYKDLGLTLAAKKAETVKELNQVRKNRRTLEVYHNNI